MAINFARFQRQAINFALCLPARSCLSFAAAGHAYSISSSCLSGLFGILKVGTYGYTVAVRLRERACMCVQTWPALNLNSVVVWLQ